MTKPFIKPIITPEEAAGKVREGTTIMLGGFNYGGVPYTVIDALHDQGTGNIRVICVDASHCNPKVPGPVGVARLIVNKQVSSMVISHMGLNAVAQQMFAKGEIDIELNPMGTLVERIRTGGAGLGGFLTPTGVDTAYEKNRQTVELDGKKFILERPLRADIAFIRAYKADEAGNLIYYGTMADPYIVMMQILESKKENGLDMATKVSLQLQSTNPNVKARDRVVKKGEKSSLYEAMDFASIWLERALAGK